MGYLSVAHMCSHMQNVAKARLAITSVPNTKQLLQLALALHRQGLISYVVRAGPTPPPEDVVRSWSDSTAAEVASQMPGPAHASRFFYL